nr:hypothetical protein [Tanacetum cinerariifolium]
GWRRTGSPDHLGVDYRLPGGCDLRHRTRPDRHAHDYPPDLSIRGECSAGGQRRPYPCHRRGWPGRNRSVAQSAFQHARQPQRHRAADCQRVGSAGIGRGRADG